MHIIYSSVGCRGPGSSSCDAKTNSSAICLASSLVDSGPTTVRNRPGPHCFRSRTAAEQFVARAMMSRSDGSSLPQPFPGSRHGPHGLISSAMRGSPRAILLHSTRRSFVECPEPKQQQMFAMETHNAIYRIRIIFARTQSLNKGGPPPCKPFIIVFVNFANRFIV